MLVTRAIAWRTRKAVVSDPAERERVASGPVKPISCRSPRPFMPLHIGDAAPDFELAGHTGSQIKLSDFRGKKNVVLAFFVLANTPT